jgi:hypothetical protein
MSGAVERLGHVFGWFGNGIGALFLLAAVGIAGNSLWTMWEVNNRPLMFEVEDPNGIAWQVMTPDRHAIEQDVASVMRKKANGEAIPEGWSVYRKGEMPADKQALWDEAKGRSAVMTREAESDMAWLQLTRGSTACLVLAFLFWVFGRSLRYIFSGPKKAVPASHPDGGRS